MKQVLKLSWIGVLVLTVACVGLMGCGSDDEGSPPTTTTVVTNVIDGVVVTNVVEVPSEPEVDAEEVPGAEDPTGPSGFLDVCTGLYENAAGSSEIGARLELSGSDVTGIFAISGNRRGFVTGTLNGFSLQMTMPVLNSDISIHMQGQLDAEGKSFQGTWTDNFGNTGTCWLRWLRGLEMG